MFGTSYIPYLALGEPLYLWIHGPRLGVIGCRDIISSVVDSELVHPGSAPS